MNKCKTCKFWSKPQDEWERERYESNGVRPCYRAVQWWDATEWYEDGEGNCSRKRIDPTLLMYVQDGSDYMATLLTDPEFGCVHHEQE